MANRIGTHIGRLIQRALAGESWGQYGVVGDYRASDHTATVALQPSGQETGYLPILVPAEGWRVSWRPGLSVWVNCARGVPLNIAGIHYNTPVPAPDGLSLEGDMHLRGALVVYGLLSALRLGAEGSPAIGGITPNAVNTTGAGSGATASLDATATDLCGSGSITSHAGAGAGRWATVKYSRTYQSIPLVLLLPDLPAGAHGLSGMSPANRTAAGFDIWVETVPAASPAPFGFIYLTIFPGSSVPPGGP